MTEIESDPVSLLWGADCGFRPRLSRAFNSMPLGLLQSRPFTVDGYNGEGLCLAMGILGRTKGLQPWRLVFDAEDEMKKGRGYNRIDTAHKISAELENKSTWYPRPNKVMRSYYSRAMLEQYRGLGNQYCAGATELALLCLDCPDKALRQWLALELEQQVLDLNRQMTQRPWAPGQDRALDATPHELETLYRAHFVSTIISLNFFSGVTGNVQPTRPDLICFALLWLAEGAVKVRRDQARRAGGSSDKPDKGGYEAGDGAPMPAWWTQNWVGGRLDREKAYMTEVSKNPAAWLLGLQDFPDRIFHWPEWPEVIYYPRYSS